ncbi:hypothetical protein SAMN04515692_12225 [Leifsonia sp. CL147]|nr:hypothetical protein SAMN04515694_12125 [Leifsonia sp. CL154]SFM02444.1 hypothetical protein SAMN04515692_12225 [Leifsonia sp. CL147]
MLAYLEFALTTDFDETDIVMLSDPRLREPLSRRWASRMAPWVALPESMSPSERGRTLAARLLADGAWFASATNVFTPDRTDRQRVLRVAKGLLKG